MRITFLSKQLVASLLVVYLPMHQLLVLSLTFYSWVIFTTLIKCLCAFSVIVCKYVCVCYKLLNNYVH